MRKLLLVLITLLVSNCLFAQRPCSDATYRQFDFWIGEWEVYGKNGNKAGTSKISVILDSCVVLEEWTSATATRGVVFSGKSFNTYNAAKQQWQQTFVDNVGGTTVYKGGLKDNVMVITTDPFYFKKDSAAIRRMSFYNLSPIKVRQHGEISKDEGKTWSTEFDLEYRRR